ncbi:MAG: S8 family serine peptidase [Bacteroidota bacterium]
MMKKLALIFIGFCGLSGIVSAQTVTNTRHLDELSVSLKQAASANYAKAISLAKKKGWPLSFTTKNGNKAVLISVDMFGLPKYYITYNNTIAAATTGANKLWPGGTSGLNLSGSSANMKNKLGVWDGGSVLGTHVELTGRVTQRDNPSATSDHSTHVAGTLMASGVNPAAKGMAFGLQGLVAYDFTNDDSEQTAEAGNGLLVSNHSYGFNAGWIQNTSQNNRWEFYGRPGENEDYKFGFYSNEAATRDEIAYNAPNYLIVKSAGNSRDNNGPLVGEAYFRFNAQGQMAAAGTRPDGISSNNGYDIIVEDGGSKNILTVGAIYGLPAGYSRKEDAVMSSFSGWGPTDDGRIKPDIVADGINVLSSTNTSNTSYAAFSGTSMSSPNAAGSVFLLQEYYSKLKSGAFLRSATLKGLAIHTADEAGVSPGPDYQFGWGVLNVKKAADVITAAVPSNNGPASAHMLVESTLAQGATYTTTVIASGIGKLQATICWTDVKGTVETTNLLNNRAKKLVNDLDIRITKGSGTSLKTYLPWTLDVNNPSAAAVPGDNVLDNVERIDIDSTIPGQTYVITVTHKGTLVKGPQAFSLLVSGVGGTVYCTSASGGGGARIDSVNFKDIHVLNSPGSKTYTDNTNYIADIEAAQTVPISVRVSTADATSNPRIVKVFIDYNNNGTFETSELAATSGILPATSSVFNGSITTPAGLTIGNIYLMRIVVRETSFASDVTACGTYPKGETQDYRVKVVDPTNDVSIREIVFPYATECASTAQYVTVEIRNNGSVDQSNIPLTVNVVTGSTTVANLAFTYPGPIAPLTSINYTFQVPFATNPATTYTVTATASAPTDQNPSNNSIVSTIATPAKPTVTAVGEICGTNAILNVTNPVAGGNYFWYTTPLSTSPFAVGASTNTSTIPTNKTYYVAKEVKTTIGPANKQVYTSGGYNVFYNNYVKLNASVPLYLESARLYIGYPGKVTFILGTNLQTTTNGFTFNIEDATTIDVYPTTPSPVKGALTLNSTADTGAIYMLDLHVPTAGDHIILVRCLDKAGNYDSLGGATIFRNNGITGANTYPMTVPNVMSITGNSATGAGISESQFYYFFYDMKIRTEACGSDRIAVVATDATTPNISQVADSLVSTIATGNQWYKDNVAIAGATGKTYKPATTGGVYKVIVTDGFGCQLTSNTVNFAITAIPIFDPQEIKLMVSPNPNKGIFNLSFEVTGKAELSIDIVSSSGQKVFNNTIQDFTGKYSKQLDISKVSSEFYILKIQHNKKNYIQKILIQR